MSRTKDSMSEQIDSLLTAIVAEGYPADSNKEIHLLDESSIQIKNVVYRLVENYREGFDFVSFEKRYQDYFDKFDFIVGDWGYEQLRLRGFYQVNQKKVPRDQMIDFLDDYLKEYCNFGCAYFVLAKHDALVKFNQIQKGLPSRKQNRPSKTPVNTLEKAELKVKSLPVLNQGKEMITKNKADKPDAFQIKHNHDRQASKKNKNKKVDSTAINKKKNFVIKQLEK